MRALQGETIPSIKLARHVAKRASSSPASAARRLSLAVMWCSRRLTW